MEERISNSNDLPRHFISMEEDIVLVCRKSKISMQEGREVEGKSVTRLNSNEYLLLLTARSASGTSSKNCHFMSRYPDW